MRALTLAPISLCFAAPALAHGGAHLHPHGAEPWLMLLGLLAAAGAGALLWGRRK